MRRANPQAAAAREHARQWHAALLAWEVRPLPGGSPGRPRPAVRGAPCVVCLYEPADWLHERMLAGPPDEALSARTGLSLRLLRGHRRDCVELNSAQRFGLGVLTPLGLLPEAQVGAALTAAEGEAERARMVRRLRAGTAARTITRTNPPRWASPQPVSRAYGLLALRVAALLGCPEAAAHAANLGEAAAEPRQVLRVP